MMKRLSIENFRGITSLEMDKLRRINLLVGKNNCGKTSVLESIFLLVGATSPQLPIFITNLRGINIMSEDIWKSFFYETNTSLTISLKCDLESEKRRLEILPFIGFEASDKSIKTETTAIDMQYISSDKQRMPLKGLSLNYIQEKEGKENKFTTQIANVKDGVQHTNPTKYTETISGFFLKPSTSMQALSFVFSEIKKNKQFETILAVLRKIEPSLRNIEYLSDGYYCDVGYPMMMPLGSMGDGITNLLRILMVITYSPKGIVLIDEIENGFHHSSLNILWEAVFEASRVHNVQVFAATHSFECAEAFNKAQEQENDTALFRIEKKADKFRVVDYDYDKLVTTIEKGWGFR
ncbi:ATPase-like protein [Candidatus Magnetoovum chiemensis]|nr:ATPase-like protein [Candidatus Magnetoovum chiemensis]